MKIAFIIHNSTTFYEVCVYTGKVLEKQDKMFKKHLKKSKWDQEGFTLALPTLQTTHCEASFGYARLIFSFKS